MSNRTIYALAFAVIGMGTRFLVFMFEWEYTWATQLYFLYLLLAVFLGVREFFAEHPDSNFKKLFKAGAQIGSVFTLSVTLFTYLFYRFIDTQFFNYLIQDRLSEAQSNGYSPEEITKLSQNLEFVFSANTQSTATLIGFMVLGFSYAAIVALILSRVPFFSREFK